MKLWRHGIVAGCLGLLVGIPTGLSISPVVAVLLGILVTAAMVFVGFKVTPETSSSGVRRDDVMLVRTGVFSVVCLVGIFAGIYLRAHDSLSPSVGAQVAQWTEAGFSPEQARDIVRFRRTGLVPAGSSVAATTHADGVAPPPVPTSLYGKGTADECDRLNPEKYGNKAAETLRAYKNEGGSWRSVAERVERDVQPDEQIAVLRFLWRSKCPG